MSTNKVYWASNQASNYSKENILNQVIFNASAFCPPIKAQTPCITTDIHLFSITEVGTCCNALYQLACPKVNVRSSSV